MSSSTSTNAFEIGNNIIKLITIEPNTSNHSSPPRPLLIFSPTETGLFPVLLFLHGYLVYNYFYSQLLQHISSHGFVVVAPQLYSIAGADANEDIKTTSEITNWLPQGLANLLPPHVKPNLGKLALAGHSRGGKDAFGSALQNQYPTTLKFSALIGVDPVDGFARGIQTPPPLLTYVPHSFNLDGLPVLVIGSGLGEAKISPLFPACAPEGVNHEEFYNECRKPAYHFVAKDYGHADMLDDVTNGVQGKATYYVCKNGRSREPMRRFVGGIMVAFLNAYLEEDSRELVAIREGHERVPLELQKVEFQV